MTLIVCKENPWERCLDWRETDLLSGGDALDEGHHRSTGLRSHTNNNIKNY